jgi:hypothetical protein
MIFGSLSGRSPLFPIVQVFILTANDTTFKTAETLRLKRIVLNMITVPFGIIELFFRDGKRYNSEKKLIVVTPQESI